MSELSVDIAINNSDITLITETWSRQEVSSSLLINVNNFIVLRKGRKSLGGGVCAIIKSSLDTRPVKIDGNYDSLELITFDIFGLQITYRFIVYYRPPNDDSIGELVTPQRTKVISDTTEIFPRWRRVEKSH